MRRSGSIPCEIIGQPPHIVRLANDWQNSEREARWATSFVSLAKRRGRLVAPPTERRNVNVLIQIAHKAHVRTFAAGCTGNPWRSVSIFRFVTTFDTIAPDGENLETRKSLIIWRTHEELNLKPSDP